MTKPVLGHPLSVERRRAGVSLDDPTAGHRGGGWRGGRGAVVASAATFGALLLGALAVAQFWPTTYEATSVVSFMPRPTAMTSAETVRLIGEKYVVIATSATTMQTAAGIVNVRAEELAQSTTAALSAGTGNVEITVELSSRQDAVDAANAVAALLVRRSADDVLALGETTSPALPSRAVTQPARTLLRAAGGVAAALVSLLVWTVLSGRSRTLVLAPRPRLHGDAL